eukprot:Gb_19145 [translate_table: standard]
MTTTTMLQRLAKNNCSLLSASCSRRNLPVSAARAMAGPSLDQVLPSYLHTSPRYSNQAMSRDADAPGIYRNIRFASFLLCQSRFLCTSSQEPSIKSSESLNSFRKTPPNGKSLVCRATESSLEANTKKPTLVKSSFWGRSQGLESDAERLVCPGCGVYMQDDHPKAPGFFVKPVEKKEKLWVDAPEDNQEVTSIENKNEESQRDSNLSVDVKEDGSVLAEEGPKKAEKPVVCARCHSLRHYGKVKDESVENLLPDFDFDHTVGARLMKTTGSRSTVVMVVDCVDFDGSFPRRAAALVSKAMEEGATAWKDGKSGNVPRLVLVATKIDLLPTQVSPTRLENWARQRSRIGGAVKLHGVHMVSAHKDWGIQNLAEHIKELAGPRGNVWVIGAQNAGKSTLINAIGKHVGGKVTHLTEAPVPGTTLGIIRIEGILPAKAKLYDTPGLLHPYQISTRLNREEQVMVHIRKELKPRSYRMKDFSAVIFVIGACLWQCVVGGMLAIRWACSHRRAFGSIGIVGRVWNHSCFGSLKSSYCFFPSLDLANGYLASTSMLALIVTFIACSNCLNKSVAASSLVPSVSFCEILSCISSSS